MFRIILLICFCVVVSSHTYAAALPSELVTRNKKDTSTPEGIAYERKAIVALLANSGILPECAPSNTPIAEPLTILFEVRRDGHIDQMYITPDTKVGKCIARKTHQRVLPAPPLPGGFVVRIDLKFKN